VNMDAKGRVANWRCRRRISAYRPREAKARARASVSDMRLEGGGTPSSWWALALATPTSFSTTGAERPRPGRGEPDSSCRGSCEE